MTWLAQTAKVGEVETPRWVDLDRYVVVHFGGGCEALGGEAVQAEVPVPLQSLFAYPAPVGVVAAGRRRSTPPVVGPDCRCVDGVGYAKAAVCGRDLAAPVFAGTPGADRHQNRSGSASTAAVNASLLTGSATVVNAAASSIRSA